MCRFLSHAVIHRAFDENIENSYSNIAFRVPQRSYYVTGKVGVRKCGVALPCCVSPFQSFCVGLTKLSRIPKIMFGIKHKDRLVRKPKRQKRGKSTHRNSRLGPQK